MDSDFLQILALIAFILFGLLGGKKKKRPQQPAPRPRFDPRTASAKQQTRLPTSQQDLLRELEGLFTGRTSAPPRRLPPPEEPTEAVSLEPVDVDETARWQAGLDRASQVRETATWEEGLHRGTGSLETLEEAGEKSHTRFHERYAQQPVARMAAYEGPKFSANDLRKAFVWSEILGAPVSMREGIGRES
jgi:hypothetical protein